MLTSPIQRQQRAPHELLRHAHEGCIRNRHRHVSLFRAQGPNLVQLILEPEPNRDGLTNQHLDDSSGASSGLIEEKARFGNDALAREEWWFDVAH